MADTSKGRSDGLHKQYFNGSPEHTGTKTPPPATKMPAKPKGC